MQAGAALNRAEIADCVRDAVPAASLPCDDEDLDRLRLKEAACTYLAVAQLQGLGQLDDAIHWWRERNRAADAITQRIGGDARADDVFGPFWSAHVGHTALLGLYVKRRLLRGVPYRRPNLIRAPAGAPGNPYLVEKWQKFYDVVDSAQELPLPADVVTYSSKYLYIEPARNGSVRYFWEAYAEISRAWERAGGRALLELTGAEMRAGRQRLAALGVPRGAWYVCLHVRSSGFKPIHDHLHEPLNADIASYRLAIEAIVERGGWVIRMGDPSMPKLPPVEGVIDYAHSDLKSDWFDLFLCGTCWFYVGTSSGLGYVPNLFAVPGVFTNWFPMGTRPLNGTDLFVPKLHRREDRGELVPFPESLAPPLGHIHARGSLRELGVTIEDNMPEDLRDVVVEMLDRLGAKATYTDEDRVLQERFDAVSLAARSHGNAHIGRDFVRKYRQLLG